MKFVCVKIIKRYVSKGYDEFFLNKVYEKHYKDDMILSERHNYIDYFKKPPFIIIEDFPHSYYFLPEKIANNQIWRNLNG